MRTAAFIDGSNIYATAKALGFSLDYKMLITHLKTKFDLTRVYYYTAIRDTKENDPIIKLVDWLEYNGVKVTTKSTREYLQVDGTTKVKGNMDVEITTDMIMMHQKVDHVILFSGDGDFAYALEKMRAHGTRVTVASTIRTKPVMCADDLRRECDEFLELDSLKEICTRPFEDRPKVVAPRFGT